MASVISPRRPFAALNSPRLQALQSAKNRQNAISAFPTSEKSMLTPSTKRARVETFDDDFDSENIDPSIFNSPSKRSKNLEGTPQKAPKFSLTTVTSSARAASSFNPPAIPSKRQTISSPSTSTTTPISHSRGSPKHKRVGLLSRRKTSGGSPFTRVDPPRFGRMSSPALPFSLDAALAGSIPSYAPKPAPQPKADTLEESMPSSWFFDIHEDTPEEEATNLMEHSACVLDISSDDDGETRQQNEARERGKENIPPPDFLAMLSNAPVITNDIIAEAETTEPVAQPVKMSAREKFAALDAMAEDRRALSDLPAADYYGPGLDSSSCVVVDGPAPNKPSGLSKECKAFDFEVPAPKQEVVEEEEKEVQVLEDPVPVEAPQVEAEQQVTTDLAVPAEETVAVPTESAPTPSTGTDVVMA